jgi:hypothetical protein
VHRLYGLTIDSPEVALPAPVVAGSTPDITLRHRIDAAFHPGERRDDDAMLLTRQGDTLFFTMWRTTEGYELSAPGVAEFLIDIDISDITAITPPEHNHELLRAVLSGGLMTIALTLRGEWVLHASAVAIDGEAFVIAGTTGQGKTTLAAILSAGPATYLSDDLVHLEPRTLLVHSGTTNLRLRPHAHEIADSYPPSVVRSTTFDGRVALTIEPPAGPTPLQAIVVPMPDHARRDVAVRRLEGEAAFLAVHRASRLWGWRDADVLRREFDRVLTLATAVPVLALHVPWGPPFVADLAEQICAALRADASAR